MNPKKWPSSVKIGLFLIAAGAVMLSLAWHFGSVIGLLGWTITILKPVFLGFAIAYVINVPMSKMEKHFTKISQKKNWNVSSSTVSTVSMILSLIFIGTTVAVILWFIIPHLIDSIKTAVNSIQTTYPKAIAYLENHGIDADPLEKAIKSINWKDFALKMEKHLNSIVKFSFSALTTVISSVFTYFTAFILAIYMLANKYTLKKQFRRLLDACVKPGVSREIQSVLSIANRSFSNFIAGQCLEAVILGVLFFITLSLLNIPYAFLLSVLIAITAVIPYVGGFIGFFIGAVMILFIDPFKALVFAITFLILQQLEGQLIYPRVVGKSVGLPPVWTLIAVLVGGELGGVLGMLIFIPLTSVIYTLTGQFIRSREAKKGKKQIAQSENLTK